MYINSCNLGLVLLALLIGLFKINPLLWVSGSSIPKQCTTDARHFNEKSLYHFCTQTLGMFKTTNSRRITVTNDDTSYSFGDWISLGPKVYGFCITWPNLCLAHHTYHLLALTTSECESSQLRRNFLNTLLGIEAARDIPRLYDFFGDGVLVHFGTDLSCPGSYSSSLSRYSETSLRTGPFR